MSFSAKGKLIYLAHPRTASIATERGLAKALPWRCKKTANHHARLDEITWKLGNEKIITTIRDPLDMLASWWVVYPKYHHVMTFSEFIKTYDHCMMSIDGRLFYFLKDCDAYMTFENLQDDFDKIMKGYGFPTAKIPMTNITPNKKPFMTYHTDETITAMWERWPKDMEMYHVR